MDHSSLKLALERAEELCSQVNEGVREKENSDRLEWIQAHVQCEGLAEVRPVMLGAGNWGRPSPSGDRLHRRSARVASLPSPSQAVVPLAHEEKCELRLGSALSDRPVSCGCEWSFSLPRREL